MLPQAYRLRSARDFAEVVRRGRRASRPMLTVHLLTAPPSSGEASPPRVGLVIGKAVGGSVLRHRTARRLRHLLRDRLEQLPAGARVVVRAAPGAGLAASATLGADLDAALTDVLRDRPRRRTASPTAEPGTQR